MVEADSAMGGNRTLGLMSATGGKQMLKVLRFLTRALGVTAVKREYAMHRRMFMSAVASAGAILPLSGLQAATEQDLHSAKQFIIEWYAAFANPRTSKDLYLSFTTPDYLLLENGAVLDRNGDLALFLNEPSDFVRRDSFDFRRIWSAGDRAFLVYFLHSEMSDSRDGPRTRDYLESAILRRSGSGWRAELLHSTRLERSKS